MPTLLENAARFAGLLLEPAAPADREAAAALRQRLAVVAIPGTPEERLERSFWRELRKLAAAARDGGMDGREFARVLGQAIRGELPASLREVPALAALPGELARRAARHPTLLVTSAMALSTAEAAGDIDGALARLEELCAAGLAVGEDDADA
jgi:hypothetical protein